MRLSHRFTTVAHNIDSLAVLAIVEQESCHNDWVSLTGGILNAAYMSAGNTRSLWLSKPRRNSAML